MNTEQKLDALNALTECHLIMRKPGDWYVSQSVEVGGDGFLHGLYGNGKTPFEAIDDHWSQLVDNLPSDRYLVTSAMGEKRKHYRWAGYMWSELPVEKAA